MSAELTIFEFKGNPVRVVELNTEPWWIAVDVCNALELKNCSKSVEQLDADDLTTTEVIDALGRSQTANIVSESGLYSLIFSSKKPAARVFKRWVTHEVLPQIRATGSFSHNGYGHSLNGTEEKRIEKMIRHVERIIADRRSGRIDNGTAATLSALTCQYCRLWDLRLRVRGGAALPVHQPKAISQ